MQESDASPGFLQALLDISSAGGVGGVSDVGEVKLLVSYIWEQVTVLPN